MMTNDERRIAEYEQDSLNYAMQELKRTALQLKAERDRMQYALENILAITASDPALGVIHEQARKGLGE